MADAELDDLELADDATEAPSERKREADPAPQCAGCHRRGVELTLLENGKRYCDRCAQEVERLMGIGPLPLGADDGAGQSAPDHEPQTAAVSADIPASDDDDDDDADHSDDDDDSSPETSARSIVSEDQPSNEDPQVGPEPEAHAELTSGATADPAQSGLIDPAEAAVDDPKPVGSSAADLAAIVAASNHEAAESTSSLISRPVSITATTEPTGNAPEEPPVMERVEEQTRPVRLEPPAVTAPTDLLGALSAERARLLEQRELLEARFRSDTEAIDERLSHVESLLGDQQDAAAAG